MNRALAAKADRAREQRLEAAKAEYSKPIYLSGPSKAELRAQAEKLDLSKVKTCPAYTKADAKRPVLQILPAWRAKGTNPGRASISYTMKRGHGSMRSLLTPDVYAAPGQVTLIPAKR